MAGEIAGRAGLRCGGIARGAPTRCDPRGCEWFDGLPCRRSEAPRRIESMNRRAPTIDRSISRIYGPRSGRPPLARHPATGRGRKGRRQWKPWSDPMAVVSRGGSRGTPPRDSDSSFRTKPRLPRRSRSEPGSIIHHDGAAANTLASLSPFHVLLGEDARLSGTLRELTKDSVRFGVGWQPAEITMPRASVQAIVQRPGEARVLADEFEVIDPSRWSIGGKPESVTEPHLSERRSLRLPAEGASLVHSLEEPLAAGRLVLGFFDDGSISAGRDCVVEFVFRGPAGRSAMRDRSWAGPRTAWPSSRRVGCPSSGWPDRRAGIASPCDSAPTRPRSRSMVKNWPTAAAPGAAASHPAGHAGRTRRRTAELDGRLLRRLATHPVRRAAREPRRGPHPGRGPAGRGRSALRGDPGRRPSTGGRLGRRQARLAAMGRGLGVVSPTGARARGPDRGPARAGGMALGAGRPPRGSGFRRGCSPGPIAGFLHAGDALLRHAHDPSRRRAPDWSCSAKDAGW